jgi:hypothetical protein|tara:strand:+ start:559 stop:966 length:408 start_codon:yes stop_codon:yes gene_type:complete
MKRNLLILALSIFIFNVLVFCKAKDVNDHNVEKIKIIISKETTDKIFSFDKTKVLILTYKIDKSPIIKFNYQVIDTDTKKELKKGVFVGEKMEWLDATTLKCTKHVGMIQKEDDQILSPETKNKIIINYSIININ